MDCYDLILNSVNELSLLLEFVIYGHMNPSSHTACSLQGTSETRNTIDNASEIFFRNSILVLKFL
jgi:hypothetical protein